MYNPDKHPPPAAADVLIVGGGPAGMFAAAAAIKMGAQVLLLEKNERLGHKLRLTGGGRGNLTNTAATSDFIEHVPGNGKFLFSSLHRFSSTACRDFPKAWGCLPKRKKGAGFSRSANEPTRWPKY